jgi:shikimate dehydrogenase
MTNISGKTTVCGIMHNAAFTHIGLDYIYIPFQVKVEGLIEAIRGMRALNIKGLNVTIPHKVKVVPLLNEVDCMAEQIGAVNTIVNHNGIIKGYNTDGSGFLQSLLEERVDPRDKNVVVIGAGGASRAITFILVDKGARVTILNRRQGMDKAVRLAAEIYNAFRRDVQALELKEENLTKVMEKVDILVNATSVGMNPDQEETPVESRWFRPGLLVCDIVYNPINTKLLREAGQAGAKTMNGLGMLVWQGAMAFEYWTGQKAPVAVKALT